MSPLLQQLIDALKCLPGVGPKSAQRMAFHLLERDREGAKNLAASLLEAVEQILEVGGGGGGLGVGGDADHDVAHPGQSRAGPSQDFLL